MLLSFGAAPEVISWPDDKEEIDPVQVSDYLLAVCFALTDGGECLEDGDRDRVDLVRRRVLLCISHELLSQV